MFIDTSGPAFPCNEIRGPNGEGICESAPGMTLRDWFAGQAVTGLIASNDHEAGDRLDDIPTYAYRIADAMLKVRTQST